MKFVAKVTEHPVISTLVATFLIWLVGKVFVPAETQAAKAVCT